MLMCQKYRRTINNLSLSNVLDEFYFRMRGNESMFQNLSGIAFVCQEESNVGYSDLGDTLLFVIGGNEIMVGVMLHVNG